MKTLKVGICFLDDENNIITKRTIGTNWSVDAEEDLKRKIPNIHMIDEIATILTENLKLQLTNEVMKDMLIEVQEKEPQ